MILLGFFARYTEYAFKRGNKQTMITLILIIKFLMIAMTSSAKSNQID